MNILIDFIDFSIPNRLQYILSGTIGAHSRTCPRDGNHICWCCCRWSTVAGQEKCWGVRCDSSNRYVRWLLHAQRPKRDMRRTQETFSSLALGSFTSFSWTCTFYVLPHFFSLLVVVDLFLKRCDPGDGGSRRLPPVAGGFTCLCGRCSPIARHSATPNCPRRQTHTHR